MNNKQIQSNLLIPSLASWHYLSNQTSQKKTDKDNYRKRRISGFELPLPPLKIDRVKRRRENLDQNLVLLHFRHRHLRVKLQNIHTPVFPIYPRLHFRGYGGHLGRISRSRCSLGISRDSERERMNPGLPGRSSAGGSAFLLIFSESEGKSEGRKWVWLWWERVEGSELRSCGCEHGFASNVFQLSLTAYLFALFFWHFYYFIPRLVFSHRTVCARTEWRMGNKVFFFFLFLFPVKTEKYLGGRYHTTQSKSSNTSLTNQI